MASLSNINIHHQMNDDFDDFDIDALFDAPMEFLETGEGFQKLLETEETDDLTKRFPDLFDDDTTTMPPSPPRQPNIAVQHHIRKASPPLLLSPVPTNDNKACGAHFVPPSPPLFKATDGRCFVKVADLELCDAHAMRQVYLDFRYNRCDVDPPSVVIDKLLAANPSLEVAAKEAAATYEAAASSSNKSNDEEKDQPTKEEEDLQAVFDMFRSSPDGGGEETDPLAPLPWNVPVTTTTTPTTTGITTAAAAGNRRLATAVSFDEKESKRYSSSSSVTTTSTSTPRKMTAAAATAADIFRRPPTSSSSCSSQYPSHDDEEDRRIGVTITNSEFDMQGMPTIMELV